MKQTVEQASATPIKLKISHAQRVGIRWRQDAGRVELVAHHQFLDAPDSLWQAIGRAIRKGRFLEQDAHALEIFMAEAQTQTPEPQWANNLGLGAFFNLHEIQKSLVGHYFDEKFHLPIRWGRSRRSRQSLSLGSYQNGRVTIHPTLDQAFVPEIVISRVVHHELCHHMLRGVSEAPHGPQFQDLEGKFKGAVEADSWVDRNINSLLGATR